MRGGGRAVVRTWKTGGCDGRAKSLSSGKNCCQDPTDPQAIGRFSFTSLKGARFPPRPSATGWCITRSATYWPQRRFIARSFSCQKGKGTTAARECCRVLTNRFPYVLKCDVSKFFAQIDHRILLDKLGTWVTCPHAMGLIARVVASHHTGDDPPPAFFPGDDWVLATLRPRGLPIGNLTSQLWANFYLDDLDHEITDAEGHGAYLRYTDDFLLFDDDKGQLWALAAMIEAHLAGLRLRLARPKSRLLATHEGVPFCGFRFLPGLQPRILGATKRRFERRRHWMFTTRMPPHDMAVRIFSWYQFSREANSEGLRRAYCGWPLDGRRRKRRCRRTRVAGASRRVLEQQESQESVVVVSQQQ
ncbi:MAG: RNA-directed DNA polymerase [Kiritimatiellia bacterium]